MTQITLTRHAIRELRDLRSSMNNRVVPEILAELQSHWTSGLVKIRGAKKVVRDKRQLGSGAYLRIALDYSNHPNEFCVIAAGLRRDGDFRDFYNQNFDALPRDPRYEWNGEIGTDWDFYISGDYNNSPIVSKDQMAAADLVIPKKTYKSVHPDSHEVGFHSLITQSPPGTGKTVTAADKACEVVSKGYEVFFLLPEVLIPQVLEYRCVKQAKAIGDERFFIGTFHQWIKHCFPKISFRLLSPDEELKRLQKAAKKQNSSIYKDAPITARDVLLYQIYIAHNNHKEDLIYRKNLHRIEELKNIRVNWWQEAVNVDKNEKCRLDYAISILDYLQNYLPDPDPGTSGTIIIVDEAQDYLLDEIKIIKCLCHHWQQNFHHQTSLWLLGDLNQRIIPVDFDWGELHLTGVQETNWPDYRTTERILTLANQFKQRLDEINLQDPERWLPKATEPTGCFKRPGDLIRVIVYPDLKTAESFLQPLIDIVSQNREQTMSDWEKKYSLLEGLVSRARVFCSDHYHVTTELRGSLEFMPVSQAKGREFESCIAFCIFDLPERYGQLEAYMKWYTQLTRARERLLIVTTQDQLDKIGKDLFGNAILTDQEKEDDVHSIKWIEYNSDAVNDALRWIIESSNDLQFDETESTGLGEMLLSDLNQGSPLLYHDLYEVLPRYKLQREKVIDLECQMIKILFDPDKAEFLTAYLNEIIAKNKTRLECLIYRGLGQSWKAASIAQSLKSSDPDTYEDIIEGIAKDLQSRKLSFEADRLLCAYGFPPLHEYQGVLQTLLNDKSKSLVSLLKNWVESELNA